MNPVDGHQEQKPTKNNSYLHRPSPSSYILDLHRHEIPRRGAHQRDPSAHHVPLRVATRKGVSLRAYEDETFGARRNPRVEAVRSLRGSSHWGRDHQDGTGVCARAVSS